MKTLGRIFFKWVLVPYVVLYTLATAYAPIDYHFFNPTRREQDQAISLQIRRYRVRVDDEEKYLTLVGEIHHYNRTESRLGEKLVDEHTSFARERARGSNVPLEDKIFQRINAELRRIPTQFYRYGSGRLYPQIADIAKNKGHEVYGLEENQYANLSRGEKTSVTLERVWGFLIAPSAYYVGRFQDTSEVCSRDIEMDPFIAKRDPTMAENLAELLKKDDVDNMLATVGNCHLNGVIRHLSNQLELEEIK